jgi:hypothetical protein
MNVGLRLLLLLYVVAVVLLLLPLPPPPPPLCCCVECTMGQILGNKNEYIRLCDDIALRPSPSAP